MSDCPICAHAHDESHKSSAQQLAERLINPADTWTTGLFTNEDTDTNREARS